MTALGRDGPGEQPAEVEGRLKLARRHLGVTEAARLLYEALGDRKERWLDPVKARVVLYLRLLIPDDGVVPDEETLEVRGARR